VAETPAEERAGLYNMPPELALDTGRDYEATITTGKGDIVVDLHTVTATTSVNNFVVLANLGFYDRMRVAYVEPGVYVVMGSPQARQDSDVGYALPMEESAAESRVMTGTLAYFPAFNPSQQAMGSSGSQFFVSLGELPPGAAPLNVFGQVTSGMEIAASLTMSDTVESITISEK
jgi:peptidyl-prolyl cis-trans isomerase B (cyclophilin B)